MPLKGVGNVKAAMQLTKESADKKLRGVFFAGLTGVIGGTPVDSGRARNNWFLTVRSPSTQSTTSASSNAGNSNRQLSKMPKSVTGKTIYFTNNLPYINRLEYDGWSEQAPSGWVRMAIKAMRNKIRKL